MKKIWSWKNSSVVMVSQHWRRRGTTRIHICTFQATCDSNPGCSPWCRFLCAMANADVAGLVSAAVRAAILARAPRPTVSAVAAAVVSAVGAHGEAACQTRLSSGRAGTQRGTARSDDDAAGCLAALLEALRAARAWQRKRKKERCRAAETAASGWERRRRRRWSQEEDRASLLPVLTWRKKETHRIHLRKKARSSGPFCGAANIAGEAEQIQDVSASLRCCPRPDAASATDSAVEIKMAHTDKCGNVTNVEGLVATERKMMDVVDWCFQ